MNLQLPVPGPPGYGNRQDSKEPIADMARWSPERSVLTFFAKLPTFSAIRGGSTRELRSGSDPSSGQHRTLARVHLLVPFRYPPPDEDGFDAKRKMEET